VSNLRDQIADALLNADAWAQLERRDDRDRFADAVMAVVQPEIAERDAEIARLTPETHPCGCPDADGSYAHLAGHTRQLVQRTDRLMAELDAQEDRIADVIRNIGEEQDRRQAAEAIAARARDLHCRDDSNPLGPWCGTCSVPWPCQTWEALTEPAQGEVPQ
jgi:hypothetical protein